MQHGVLLLMISLLLLFCNSFPNKISYDGFELLGRNIEDSSISSYLSQQYWCTHFR